MGAAVEGVVGVLQRKFGIAQHGDGDERGLSPASGNCSALTVMSEEEVMRLLVMWEPGGEF